MDHHAHPNSNNPILKPTPKEPLKTVSQKENQHNFTPQQRSIPRDFSISAIARFHAQPGLAELQLMTSTAAQEASFPLPHTTPPKYQSLQNTSPDSHPTIHPTCLPNKHIQLLKRQTHTHTLSLPLSLS